MIDNSNVENREFILEAIGFFYRNDEPDGIGFKLEPTMFNRDLDLIMDDVMDKHCSEFLENRKRGEEHLKVYLRYKFSYLNSCPRKVDTITELLNVLGTIWLLEYIGAIDSDEYNGCTFYSMNGRYIPAPTWIKNNP